MHTRPSVPPRGRVEPRRLSPRCRRPAVLRPRGSAAGGRRRQGGRRLDAAREAVADARAASAPRAPDAAAARRLGRERARQAA
eukprot:884494-Prymnesium_polylepis.1